MEINMCTCNHVKVGHFESWVANNNAYAFVVLYIMITSVVCEILDIIGWLIFPLVFTAIVMNLCSALALTIAITEQCHDKMKRSA